MLVSQSWQLPVSHAVGREGLAASVRLTPLLTAVVRHLLRPPARYTLTNQALKITDVDICRCFGSIRCTLCGVQTKQNNIDLNYVKDVDFQVRGPHALPADCPLPTALSEGPLCVWLVVPTLCALPCASPSFLAILTAQ